HDFARRVPEGITEIDSLLLRDAADLVFADRELARRLGQIHIQPVGRYDFSLPWQGVAKQHIVGAVNPHRVVDPGALLEQLRQVFAAAGGVVQYKGWNQRYRHQRLPRPFDDLGLLEGRLLDQSAQFLPRVHFRPRAISPVVIGGKHQRRQRRQDYQQDDPAADVERFQFARSGAKLDFQVVDQPRAAQARGRDDDQVAVAFRGLPQVGLPAHRDVVRLPAVARELGHRLLVEALKIARPAPEFVPDLFQHLVQPRRFLALLRGEVGVAR